MASDKYSSDEVFCRRLDTECVLGQADRVCSSQSFQQSRQEEAFCKEPVRTPASGLCALCVKSLALVSFFGTKHQVVLLLWLCYALCCLLLPPAAMYVLLE